MKVVMKVGDKVVRAGDKLSVEWVGYCKGLGILPTDELVVTKVSNFMHTLHFSNDDVIWLSANYLKVHHNTEAVPSDAVTSPAHYQFFPDLEDIQVIASSLTLAEFRGYCCGNRLKYRLRAGNKDKLEQDIKKSDYYIELYEKHKHLCKDK